MKITVTSGERSARTRRESRRGTVAARTASRWRTCSVRSASSRMSTRRSVYCGGRPTVLILIRHNVSLSAREILLLGLAKYAWLMF